jgi:hypothetical protein
MTDPLTAATTAKASDTSVNVRQEVADALYLLDYAVANGVKTADGHPLSQDVVTAIKSAAEKIGLLAGGAQTATLSAADWAAFEMAYYELATALAPVTAETLRNTRTVPYAQRTWPEHIIGYSPAISFTRLLWAITVCFGAFVIWSAWYLAIKAEEGDTNSYLHLRAFIEVTTPWVYGGLGACVFLLRSAHVFIHERCFDIRRKPEYLNRILLGAVSGGAIILFIDQLTDDQGNVIKLSSAALGFLSGYNTDFLFSTIERVMAALLPKVGVDSVQKAAPGGVKPADLNDLADRMDKAEGADKEFYRAILAQLTKARIPPQRNG